MNIINGDALYDAQLTLDGSGKAEIVLDAAALERLGTTGSRAISIVIIAASATAKLTWADADTRGLTIPAITEGEEPLSLGPFRWRPDADQVPLRLFGTAAETVDVMVLEVVR